MPNINEKEFWEILQFDEIELIELLKKNYRIVKNNAFVFVWETNNVFHYDDDDYLISNCIDSCSTVEKFLNHIKFNFRSVDYEIDNLIGNHDYEYEYEYEFEISYTIIVNFDDAVKFYLNNKSKKMIINNQNFSFENIPEYMTFLKNLNYEIIQLFSYY